MKSLITIVFSVFLSFPMLTHAQQEETVTQLDEVVVTNSRLQAYAVGHYLINVDTQALKLTSMTNAAELFRKLGLGHIRSYGVGGITTPSFRGTGASHTAILWNGISLVSPLNGQSDLSLLPISFIDDASIQSGGSASLFGSGAIGGTIQFNNKAVFQQGWQLGLTENIGSFNTFFHGLNAGFSGKKFISSTRFFRTTSDNNFSYLDKNVAPPVERDRQHTAFEQFGILQQNYLQLSERQLLSARIWYQDNHTDVPNPTHVSAPALATQRDQFFRSMLEWNFDYNKGHVFAQSAYVHHLLDYRDPLIAAIAKTSFDTFIETIENTWAISDRLEWTSGLNYTFESALGEELEYDNPQRSRTAIYSAFKYQASKWNTVVSLRQELVKNEFAPFSPSIGLEYSVIKKLAVFTNVSRSYRIPTFNDLYWNGAAARGNIDLRPELSWSEELGFKVNQFNTAVASVEIQAAVFSSKVDNWIQWAPTGSIWVPTNIKKVWSRGVETNISAHKQLGRFRLHAGLRYSFTRSTNEEVYDVSAAGELHKQLFFTPKHESGTTFGIEWKKWQLSFVNNYTGKQYTDGDNNEFYAMRAYNISNVWLNREWIVKKISGNILFEVNNVFDKDVISRPGYPLPGRNFRIGVTLKLNKPGHPTS